MAKDPAFLFYPGDYLRDTQCLSESVQVAYDRIMCEHMRNICISQTQLNFFTKRLNSDQKDELLQVLTKVKDGYQIAWIAESIEKRRNYSNSRRKNRIGSKKICKTYDSHMEIENENEIVIENTIKEKKLEIFESIFNDERFVEELSIAHKGKKLEDAWEQCWIYHSQTPSPPTEVWQWKQKLSTWLSNTKSNGHSKNGKQSSRDLAEALAERIRQDALGKQP